MDRVKYSGTLSLNDVGKVPWAESSWSQSRYQTYVEFCEQAVQKVGVDNGDAGIVEYVIFCEQQYQNAQQILNKMPDWVKAERN